MKNHTQIYSKTILNELKIDIEVTKNQYDIPVEKLFSMAARKNPKRSFLFVSKLLGKHLPVHPQIPLLAGQLLLEEYLKVIENRSLYNEKASDIAKGISGDMDPGKVLDLTRSYHITLKKPTLFIGFAETATGLGHAVFSQVRGDSAYIHTTRTQIKEMKSQFDFEEEHSHATSHLCYSANEDLFNNYDRIVLVDDEITTGKTAINLIKALNEKFPGKEYAIVSVLDWRLDEHVKMLDDFKAETGLNIDIISILRGIIKCNDKPIIEPLREVKALNEKKTEVKEFQLGFENGAVFTQITEENKELEDQYFLKDTGRFGIDANFNQEIYERCLDIGNMLKEKRLEENCNTLCMGFGEFIYLPCLIASHMGDNIRYSSPSRSPIYISEKEAYPLQSIITMSNPYDQSVKNFIYNVNPNKYDEIFMFFERKIRIEVKDYLIKQFSSLGIKRVNFVIFECLN